MQNSMIVLDIDGCLISENGNVDDDYYKSLAWLAKFIRAANVSEFPNICLCSGRSAVFSQAISFLIGWPQFPAIVENGAGFFDPLKREFRVNPKIPLKTLKRLKEILIRIAPAIIRKHRVLSLSLGQLVNVTFRGKSALNAASIENLRDNIRRYIVKSLKKKVLKTLILGNSITIAPARINKARAVELLAKEKLLDLKQCIGIGDSKSDILFLEKLGFVGCPQNADNACKEFVKQRGGRISPYSYARGVVDIIQWFIPKSESL